MQFETTTEGPFLVTNFTSSIIHRERCLQPSLFCRYVSNVMIGFPIASLGMIGNLLAFVVLLRMRPVTTTNIWLGSLTITDFITLSLTVLIRAVRYIHIYNEITCSVYMVYLAHMYVYLFPWNFYFRLLATWVCVAMTFDRFVAVCSPLRALGTFAVSKTYRLLVVIIFLTFIFSLPRVFESELVIKGPNTTKGNDSTSAVNNLHGNDTNNNVTHAEITTEYIYSAYDADPCDPYDARATELVTKNNLYVIGYRIVAFLLIMYVIPVLLLVVMNFKLVGCLRQADDFQRKSITKSIMTKRNDKNRRSITCLVVTIVTLTMISSSVAMLVHLLWSLESIIKSCALETSRRYISLTSNVITTFNSAINIFIYFFFSMRFRDHFFNIFCGTPIVSHNFSGRHSVRTSSILLTQLKSDVIGKMRRNSNRKSSEDILNCRKASEDILQCRKLSEDTILESNGHLRKLSEDTILESNSQSRKLSEDIL